MIQIEDINMQPNKDILLGQEARRKMKEGIKLATNVVRVTLGPRGRNVAISRPPSVPHITNDGAISIRSLQKKDPFLQMGIDFSKAVTSRTERIAKDGTTTTAILHDAITDYEITPQTDVMRLRQGIDYAVKEIVQELKSIAKAVNTYEDLYNVALVSVEDPTIASTVAKLVLDIGPKGVVVVEEGEKIGVFAEKTPGYVISSGFAAPYIINNGKNLTGEYNDVPILVTDKKIMFSEKLVPLFQQLYDTGIKQVMVIADDIDGEALQTFSSNKANNFMDIIPVRFSTFGEGRFDQLQDIAIRCGTRVLGDRSNTDLKDILLVELGFAKRVVVGRDTTIILNGDGKDAVVERVKELKELLKTAEEPLVIERRIANLEGNIANVKVGALIGTERKYLKDKVDDAIGATQGAMEEGVVDGGGYAFMKILQDFPWKSEDPQVQEGIDLIKRAIQYPYYQLLINCNVPTRHKTFWTWLTKRYDIEHRPYNAKSGLFVEDLIADGVIDPVKVTTNALMNAASDGALFLTTEVAVGEDVG